GPEGHGAAHQRVDGVVGADADAGARMPLGAALADDDIAGNDRLAAELLDAEAAARRVTTVAGRTACFLVCHGSGSLLFIALGGLGRRLGLCRGLLAGGVLVGLGARRLARNKVLGLGDPFLALDAALEV